MPIEFKRKLTENDIPKVPDEQPPILERLRVQYGKPVDDLLAKFDGSTSIQQAIHELPYDKDAIWFLINKLVEEGCLVPLVGS